MADGDRNGWKIFGIVLIALLAAAAIAVGAFFIGRGTETGQEGTTSTTQAIPAATPAAPSEPAPQEVSEPSGGAGTPTPTAPATTERYVVGEGEGATPCIGGTHTVTHTIYYSDGSTDTTTVTEPCP